MNRRRFLKQTSAGVAAGFLAPGAFAQTGPIRPDLAAQAEQKTL